MEITLTFEDFDPAAFVLESRAGFLHSFKNAARVFAESAEDTRLFEAQRRVLALKINNYRLPLMASFGKMPDACAESKLRLLTMHLTQLYEFRNDATKEEVLHYSDQIASSYESLVDYLQGKPLEEIKKTP